MNSLNLEMLTLDLSERSEPQLATPSHSPPRKRLKIAQNDEAYNLNNAQDLLLENLVPFDICPVYARNHATWNQLLAEHPNIWPDICFNWYRNLSIAFEERNVCLPVFVNMASKHF